MVDNHQFMNKLTDESHLLERENFYITKTTEPPTTIIPNCLLTALFYQLGSSTIQYVPLMIHHQPIFFANIHHYHYVLPAIFDLPQPKAKQPPTTTNKIWFSTVSKSIYLTSTLAGILKSVFIDHRSVIFIISQRQHQWHISF